jgi:hypothetical protein
MSFSQPFGQGARRVLFVLCCVALPAGAAIDASTTTSSTQTVTGNATHAEALQLAKLHDIDRLSLRRLNEAREAAISLLVRQNLQVLDADDRLPPARLNVLAKRIEADIRPVVTRALAQVNQQDMAAALIDTYSRSLSRADADALLGYYRSPTGRQYLAFSQQLDAALGSGMLALGAQSFSFARTDSELLTRRRALIDMSSLARQMRAAQVNGGQRPPAAAGLVGDLLANQCGKSLDAITARYARQLKGFAAFQQSAAARAEDRVLWQWSTAMTTRFSPIVTQANRELDDKRPLWHKLAHDMAASGAQAD